jgi:hypothetical protein
VSENAQRFLESARAGFEARGLHEEGELAFEAIAPKMAELTIDVDPVRSTELDAVRQTELDELDPSDLAGDEDDEDADI